MSTSVQPGTWSVDPTESVALFTVRNLVFKTVQGQFPIVAAEVSVDPDGIPRSVSATLDASGFSTDNPKRDAHVRGKDFLHVDEHPELVFHSTAITARPEGRWEIDGVLTLRDVASGVRLAARTNQATDDSAKVTAIARLDRRTAGLGYGPSFLVGRKVDVALNLTLRRTGQSAG